MADFSGLHAEVATRLTHVLSELHGTLTVPERDEVLEFLNVKEYGLALDTLSHILVEEEKPLDASILHQIDGLAAVMHLRDERFMYDLHNYYDRRVAHN